LTLVVAAAAVLIGTMSAVVIETRSRSLLKPRMRTLQFDRADAVNVGLTLTCSRSLRRTPVPPGSKVPTSVQQRCPSAVGAPPA
jgi:hypothetical protein